MLLRDRHVNCMQIQWIPKKTPYLTDRVALIRYPGSTSNLHSQQDGKLQPNRLQRPKYIVNNTVKRLRAASS